MNEELTFVRGIEGNEARFYAFKGLIACFGPTDQDLLQEARNLVREIEGMPLWSLMVCKLSEHLPEHERPTFLNEAIEAAKRIEQEGARSEHMFTLSKFLPLGNLAELREVLRLIGEFQGRRKKSAISSLALRLRIANQVLCQADEELEGEEREIFLEAKELANTLSPLRVPYAKANVEKDPALAGLELTVASGLKYLAAERGSSNKGLVFWLKNMLDKIGDWPRIRVVAALGVMASAIHHAGGESVVLETAKAIAEAELVLVPELRAIS